jgi:hypothetical protein
MQSQRFLRYPYDCVIYDCCMIPMPVVIIAYSRTIPFPLALLLLCDAYVLLSVMMMSSLCLDSPLLAVVPYCCLSPLFMYLLMNACRSSFFILRSPFISYVFVYTTLYLFPLYVSIIISHQHHISFFNHQHHPTSISLSSISHLHTISYYIILYHII